ncbi:MAG: cupin domain-containing protein [Bryobacteraceae bacterium]
MTNTIEMDYPPVAANALEPVVVLPGKGRTQNPIALVTHELVLKVTGADSGGAFAVGVLRAEPMSGPPLHVHTREDEWFYVLKGELTVQVGDRRFTCGPGTSVFAPRDVPHTWQNCSNETVEALGMITPAGFEGFLWGMSLGPREPEAVEALMKRYGLTIAGPPLA